ncbi:MAG: glycoside hydrolase [Bacteroidales bacterium]|nr:glycoside hydrolase [Bacteroidales bacterium]
MNRLRTIAAAAAFLLTAASAAASDIVLSNSRVRIVISGSGEFAVKEYSVDGKDILQPSGSTVPLWIADLLGPQGETPKMQPRWAYYDGGILSPDGQSAEFTWRLVIAREAKWPVKVTVSLPSTSELAEWTVEAKLPAGWILTDLEFPRISVRRPEGVKGIMSVGYGAEYDIPRGDKIMSTYPSCTGSMEMILAHSPEGTLYYAARDREGSGKILEIRGEGNNLTFVQRVAASYGWTTPGGEFSLPWATSTGFNPDNWENTVVKWYRPFARSCEWGRKNIGNRKISRWVREADLWLRPADATPQTMQAVRDAVAMYGKGIGLHWYYWHGHPFDSYYPEYFPTQPGFKEMVAEARSLGCRVTPYINGRLWDPATDSYQERNGAEASCRRRDGSLYTEIYSSKVVNTVTCPASPIWQDVLKETNRRILKELKTDGVYMDQIGAAASEPCYAEGHPHAKGGGPWWPQAYRSLLEDMRRTVYGSSQAMTTEENAECYIDLFDMMLVVNSPHGPSVRMIPLFPLVYSDRCIYSGFTYVPWRLNDGSFRYITMKSLLWGAQLGWVDPVRLLRPGNEAEAEFLGTLAAFRKTQRDIFPGGRFLSEFIPGGDNPKASIPGYQVTSLVMGACWENKKGETCLILVNMDTSDHEVSTPDGKRIKIKALDAIRI